GIDVALHRGEIGAIYNIGGGTEKENLEVMRAILDGLGKPHSLLTFVEDRPGHDRRYSLDCSKLRALGWAPERGFEEALAETIRWYRHNEAWWRAIKSGEYAAYYQANYGQRFATGSTAGQRRSGSARVLE
ncbi:MAG TPA: dTDP-glucose 4,6-dehydratase, partial [Dehalococcoidia bacterium]|nr:dTDP-glucose 4,6-dehydratase [Dehalococcoidia bacterium]